MQKKKRPAPISFGRERSALAAETAEPKQSSRGSENRILIELPDRLGAFQTRSARVKIIKFARLMAATGSEGGQRAATTPLREVATHPSKEYSGRGRVEMLKTVIQKKNVDGLPRLEPRPSAKPVLPDTK